jgi:hypothetical protein
MEQCDFAIFLKKSAKYSLFSKKDDEGLFRIGVEEAEKYIPEIKKAMDS